MPRVVEKQSKHGKPLWIKLVLITVSLITVAIFLAGVITVSLLRSSLIARVDHDLASSGPDLTKKLLDRVSSLDQSDYSEFLPSEYYIVFEDTNGRVLIFNDHRQEEVLGHPKIAKLTSFQIQSFTESVVEQTLPGSISGTNWRAITLPVRSAQDGNLVGVAFVALPLSHVDRIVGNTVEIMAISALTIIGIAGVVSWLSVRRSLRPLREMETTAKIIASGDLSQRVPEGHPDTEVGALASSFNTMLIRIEEAFRVREASDERMRQFASDASHELRTPLATVRGYAEIYRLGGVPEDKIPEAMQRIESEAKRMGILVEDLLQITRLDEGRPLQITKVNLTQVTRDAVIDFRVRAPKRKAKLTTLDNIDDDTSPIADIYLRCDADHLQQIVANLLGNVLQHTPTDVPVEVAIGKTQKTAVIEVRDHGPGIKPEDAKRIFERFYRADKSRSRASGGSGLGIAIVRKVVNSHGGSVKALQTPGTGITIRIELPIELNDSI